MPSSMCFVRWHHLKTERILRDRGRELDVLVRWRHLKSGAVLRDQGRELFEEIGVADAQLDALVGWHAPCSGRGTPQAADQLWQPVRHTSWSQATQQMGGAHLAQAEVHRRQQISTGNR